MHIESAALIVDDYDEAIRFFVDGLGFELIEDSASMTNDGRPKRWVRVKPPGAETALLLARADGDQRAAVGAQYAGRVGLFLRVEDFEGTRRRMLEHGVEFVNEPRDEPYGMVAVFVDVAGNKWDLLGPPRAR
jgi:catechol 2,3-dioxygenase-like lactoylglutathione lyase family enzyme